MSPLLLLKAIPCFHCFPPSVSLFLRSDRFSVSLASLSAFQPPMYRQRSTVWNVNRNSSCYSPALAPLIFCRVLSSLDTVYQGVSRLVMRTCFALSPIFFKQFQAISDTLVATEFSQDVDKFANLGANRRLPTRKERRVSGTTKPFNEKQRDIWKIGNSANEKITESVNQR